MDLTLLLDYVIPSGGILYKHCNGAWDFYKSDRDLEDGISYMSQDTNENAHQFLERLVQQLMKDEGNDEERLVAVDYAIWSNYKERT